MLRFEANTTGQRCDWRETIPIKRMAPGNAFSVLKSLKDKTLIRHMTARAHDRSLAVYSCDAADVIRNSIGADVVLWGLEPALGSNPDSLNL